MKCFLFVVLVLSAIASCSDSSDENKEAVNKYIGSWELSCYQSTSGIYIFSDESYSGEVTTYTESDCTGDIATNETFSAPYSLGRDVIVESGVTAQEIDILFDINGEEFHMLELIYRDGEKVYWGLEAEDDSRPDDINFNVFYTLKQM